MNAAIYGLGITQEGVMPDGSACGPDMEYAQPFIALNALATSQEERQVGNSVLPGREPDWNEVFAAGIALLEKSRDLRIIAITAQAAVYKYGLTGLAQSLRLAAHWLQAYWEEVHPALVIDGEFDPLMRSNAIASISDASGLVRQLRQVNFLVTPIGAITVGDAEKLVKGVSVEEGAVIRSLSELRQAVEAESVNNQEVFAHLQGAHQSLADIQQRFRDQLDYEYWPNLALLTEVLESLLSILPGQAASDVSELNEAEVPGEQATSMSLGGNTNVGANVPAALPTALKSAADAFAALALARKYFEEHEPSHPAPLLIRRIEKLKGKDFFAIIQELTPEGLQQLQAISGASGEASS